MKHIVESFHVVSDIKPEQGKDYHPYAGSEGGVKAKKVHSHFCYAGGQ